MRKNVLVCLLAVGALCLVSSALYAAHTDHHCGYCHQPHPVFDPNSNDAGNWGVPLFATAKNLDNIQYDTYSSLWFDKYGITVGQPNGSTKLCLGCHDGSYTYGSPTNPKQMKHVFGQGDLNKSHPVSINYAEALGLGAALKPLNTTVPQYKGGAATIEGDMLDDHGNVQCTSCHDVHNTGTPEGALKWDSGAEFISLCKACHNK